MVKEKRKGPGMLLPTIVMAVLALVLLYLGYQQGAGQHQKGLMQAFRMTVQILPLLLFAFIVGSMIQVLVSQETISRWVGTESGLRGVLFGTVAGGFAPGGPYVSLPIVAGLIRSGASVGTVVAFLTGWSLWSVGRFPMDIGILGWKLALIRFACTCFFPPIAGLLAQTFFGGIRLT